MVNLFDKKVLELDEKIKRFDNKDTRKEAADAFLEKAYLYTKKIQYCQKEEEKLDNLLNEIGNLFYQAILRYKMVEELGLIATVINFIKTNNLQKSHSRLEWLIKNIEKQDNFKLASDQRKELPFSIDNLPDYQLKTITSPRTIKIDYYDDRITTVIEEINEKNKYLLKAEEEGEVDRKRIIEEFIKLLKQLSEIYQTYKLEQKDQQTVARLIKEIGNKCLLRCLLALDVEHGLIIINEALKLNFELNQNYIKKITDMKKIIDHFIEGKKTILWLPKKNLRETISNEEKIIEIMKNGYFMNIKEELELKIMSLYEVDLIHGFTEIPVTEVFKEVSKASPLTIILSLFSQFSTSLLVVEYLVEEEEGIMVVPTGDINKVQVIYLENLTIEK